MINEVNQYKLHGYIQYIPEDGFITPVYQMEDEFWVELIDIEEKVSSYEVLPNEYVELMQTYEDNYCGLGIGKKCTFGVRIGGSLLFGERKKITEEIKNIKSTIPQDLKEFIDEKSDSAIADTIWEECLKITSAESEKMTAIIKSNFSVLSYTNNELILFTENKGVKEQFETRFKRKIEEGRQKIEPDFRLTVTTDEVQRSVGALTTPHHYYGGDTVYQSGSYFLGTSIKSHPDLDDATGYVVGEFNAHAYHNLQYFLESASQKIYFLSAGNGQGKTRLLLEGFRFATRLDRGQAGLLSAIKPNALLPASNISQSFEIIRQAHLDFDYLFIDDAHFILDSQATRNYFVDTLSYWMHQNTKIVVSVNDEWLSSNSKTWLNEYIYGFDKTYCTYNRMGNIKGADIRNIYSTLGLTLGVVASTFLFIPSFLALSNRILNTKSILRNAFLKTIFDKHEFEHSDSHQIQLWSSGHKYYKFDQSLISRTRISAIVHTYYDASKPESVIFNERGTSFSRSKLINIISELFSTQVKPSDQQENPEDHDSQIINHTSFEALHDLISLKKNAEENEDVRRELASVFSEVIKNINK